jgi:rhodanese-related sulfurtransferase
MKFLTIQYKESKDVEINSLNSEDTYYIHCAGGYRSVIAASIFKAKGLHNVIDVAGGFGAIQKTDLNENCYNLQESCPS